MAASLDLHRLFSMTEGYLYALRVPDRDVQTLRRAREDIRSALKTAFANWDVHVKRAALFEGAIAKSVAQAPVLTPRFHIQGSFAYFTVNDCQKTPPQQIDQDDGVFLPVTFLMLGGIARPAVVSRAYFDIVERALAPLCEAKGWTIRPKNTCVRVVISPRLHIDLPLYAVRDDAFQRAVKARAASAMERIEKVYEREELDEDVYADIAGADVMLAHRTKGWIQSEPRALERWFKNVLEIYGEQVRRIVRCFKGLRDDAWEESDLTSIALMKAIADAYDQVGALDPNRDDLAMIKIGEKLAEIFAGPIVNPVLPHDPECNLDAKWTPKFRAALIEVVSARVSELRSAIYGSVSKTAAIRHARAAFGDRIPDNTGLISLIGAAAQVIRNEQPTPQPRPVVPRTRSG